MKLQGVTVLVVEDHADSRDALCQIVASFGADVVEAADGREALDAVSRKRPNLVFCDLRMPNVDGFEFVQTVRRDPQLSTVPVIAVTALDSTADFQRTFAAGFDGHLVKPVSFAVIEAQLRRVFASGSSSH